MTIFLLASVNSIVRHYINIYQYVLSGMYILAIKCGYCIEYFLYHTRVRMNIRTILKKLHAKFVIFVVPYTGVTLHKQTDANQSSVIKKTMWYC